MMDYFKRLTYTYHRFNDVSACVKPWDGSAIILFAFDLPLITINELYPHSTVLHFPTHISEY